MARKEQAVYKIFVRHMVTWYADIIIVRTFKYDKYIAEQGTSCNFINKCL